MTRTRLLAGLVLAQVLVACTGRQSPAVITPLPPGHLSTAVALTLQAARPVSTSTEAPQTFLATPTEQAAFPTQTLTPQPSATPAPATQALLPTEFATQPTLTQTIEIPVTPIQIHRMGELSKVAAPLKVELHLTSRTGRRVRIELHGEDGRLLVRLVKPLPTGPWSVVYIDEDLDFEIAAAAEVGRLVIYVEDEKGQLIDVNSINLILLGHGPNDLYPPNALQQAIVIQEPRYKTLITGGILYVSGVARPNTGFPLRVQLVAEDGRVVGQRLAALNIPKPGEYGSFAAEVPYSVAKLTPARLIVYEDGETISDMTHLSSVEVLLSP